MSKSVVARLSLLVLACALFVPRAARAQSAIAGEVKDTSGALMPGVVVEAASPALIEKVRSVVSDAQGQYKIIDLRPGTYSVTFTLNGFNTVKRDGVVLEANFTANVNAELKVGALEETITVSGEAPVVDVQSTQRRQVMTQELLEALPTPRTFSTNTVAAITTTADVGASGAMQHLGMTVYGSTESTELMVDGMLVRTANLQPGQDQNFGAYEEMVYTVAGGGAEANSGSVIVNMIPKTGGNQFKGEGIGLFSNDSLTSSNLSPDLAARGVTLPPGLWKLWDINEAIGGPVKTDRLWFFFSHRDWATNNYVANAYDVKTGKQGVYDNHLKAVTLRLTSQLTPKHKLTASYDWLTKYQGHLGIDAGNVEPKASKISRTPVPVIAQLKWTAAMNTKLLFEAGLSLNTFTRQQVYEPEVARMTATNPYGDIAKTDLVTGYQWNASPGGEQHWWVPARHYSASTSYVTGSHSFKTGVQWTTGYVTTNFYTEGINGAMTQRYRNGVPDSVAIYNNPVLPRTNLDYDIGIFAQDSWTFHHLTINPGIRYDMLRDSFPEQQAPAGRFIPARDFAAVDGIINWKDASPRIGVVYDLFGNGKTALKASIGKYVPVEATGQVVKYNPMVLTSDTRTWTDLNKDDIAESNEIGPPTASGFGLRRNINPDPDLKRPYSWLTSVSLQHELGRSMSVAVAYNRRDYRRLIYTTNLLVPVSRYTPVQINDPRNNGEKLTVHNEFAADRGLLNELDTNSDNNRQRYNGVDISFGKRFKGGTFQAGTSTGRRLDITCDVEDPNNLRFCDQTQLNVPFRTQFKMFGNYALPYGVRLSGVFQRVPGSEIVETYSIGRAIVPTLVQTTVNLRLSEPGTQFYDPYSQIDLTLSRDFRVGNVRITPKAEGFNLTNAAPALTQVLGFGSSFGTPLTVLPARVLQLSVQVKF